MDQAAKLLIARDLLRRQLNCQLSPKSKTNLIDWPGWSGNSPTRT